MEATITKKEDGQFEITRSVPQVETVSLETLDRRINDLKTQIDVKTTALQNEIEALTQNLAEVESVKKSITVKFPEAVAVAADEAVIE